MTTIVYRHGIMAADTRAYAGFNGVLGQKRKIRRLSDGSLVGVSSNVPGVGELLMDWIEAGMPSDHPRMSGASEKDGFTALLVAPDGTAKFSNGEFFFSGPISADFFSIGSGKGPADGALLMGASAVRAVEIACMCDVYTALPIDTLIHEGADICQYRMEI